MKSIATINFKGGVGKMTITWLLAKYAAEEKSIGGISLLNSKIILQVCRII